MAQPAPGEFDRYASDPLVARFADALVVLDELFIRRRDLHQAIEALRMARQYFGGNP